MGGYFSTFPTKTFHLWFLMGAETFFWGPKTFLSPFREESLPKLSSRACREESFGKGEEGGLEGGGEVERRSEGKLWSIRVRISLVTLLIE